MAKSGIRGDFKRLGKIADGVGRAGKEFVPRVRGAIAKRVLVLTEDGTRAAQSPTGRAWRPLKGSIYGPQEAGKLPLRGLIGTFKTTEAGSKFVVTSSKPYALAHVKRRTRKPKGLHSKQAKKWFKQFGIKPPKENITRYKWVLPARPSLPNPHRDLPRKWRAALERDAIAASGLEKLRDV